MQMLSEAMTRRLLHTPYGLYGKRGFPPTHKTHVPDIDSLNDPRGVDTFS